MIGSRVGVTRFVVAGLVAASTLATGLPAYAQQAPGGGGAYWAAAPGAVGDNTYVGRVEAPRNDQRVADGANLLVSGWAVDTTARGWAGFDSLEIWSGQKDASDAKKLATGSVGLARPDLGEALGGTYARSGFSASLPASVLTTLQPGKHDLGVYLHTPDKGWYHHTTSINLAAAPTGVNEPINVILRPLDGSIISDKQRFEKFTFFGYALDQTPITDDKNQTMGSCNCGISTVTMYMDAIDPAHNLGAAAVGGLTVAFANKGKPASQPTAQFSPVTREYGSQWDNSGWAFSINPREISAGEWHTFYAVARSSITGKTSTASVTMMIKDIPENLKIVVP